MMNNSFNVSNQIFLMCKEGWINYNVVYLRQGTADMPNLKYYEVAGVNQWDWFQLGLSCGNNFKMKDVKISI